VLLSTLSDSDVTMIRLLQTLYIWGLVLPFGWCAFSNLRLQTIARVLMVAASVSSVVGVLQGVGIIPPLNNQNVFRIIGTSFSRAAGLSLQPNELVAFLAATIVLVVYLRTPTQRFAMVLLAICGLCSTVSKEAIVVVLPLAYWAYREGLKTSLANVLRCGVLCAAVVAVKPGVVSNVWQSFRNAASYRVSGTGESISVRTRLIDESLELSGECTFLGYGFEGSGARMVDRAGHNVHVYFLGMILICGLPGTLLLIWGLGLMIWEAWRTGQTPAFIMLVATSAILCTHTVVLLSIQSLPLMLAGTAVAQRARPGARAISEACFRNQHPQHAQLSKRLV
jgi:hypothetical protein